MGSVISGDSGVRRPGRGGAQTGAANRKQGSKTSQGHMRVTGGEGPGQTPDSEHGLLGGGGLGQIPHGGHYPAARRDSGSGGNTAATRLGCRRSS